MRRALCWLTKAFLSVLPLKKWTVQPIFVLENMNLFVHGCRGQTWQNTLIQMCHSECLLSSPADDIWNETRLSQSVLYWIHQSHTARWQLCLSLKGPGLDDRVVTRGCSICLHCAILFSTTCIFHWQCLCAVLQGPKRCLHGGSDVGWQWCKDFYKDVGGEKKKRKEIYSIICRLYL